MRFTRLLAVSLLLVVPDAVAAQGCEGEKHRDFDFWIGAWTVTTADGKVAGTNLVQSTLGGCVVTERWVGASGSEGTSYNMYYERDGRWHQTWVDNAGTRLDLTGGLDEKGRMVLSGTMPAADGKKTLHEIAWTPNSDGTVTQHWRATQDGGTTWRDLFVGTYTRDPEE